MHFPKISVLVVFYKEQNTLVHCFESIASQNYPNIEIVIVNDGSGSLDSYGKRYIKSIKSFTSSAKKSRKKKFSLQGIKNHFSTKYIELPTNHGTLEARRIASYNATGEYSTYIDCDDTFFPDAILTLWQIVQKTNADIVHCSGSCFLEDKLKDEKFIKHEKTINNVYEGELVSTQITESLLNKKHNAFLCTKLFLTQNIQKAFSYIPEVDCCFAEDFLIYYFITLFSKKYVGNNAQIYKYNLHSGITSTTTITNIQRWKKVCSVSSVFTILYSYFDTEIIPNEHKNVIKSLCLTYLKNNLEQFKNTVDDSIKEEAYKVLCDYWGENFVKRVEKDYLK